MGLALQIAGSFGDLDAETQQRLGSLPGIASALRPKEGSGKGLFALMQLATVLSNESQSTPHQECESNIQNFCSNGDLNRQTGNGCSISKYSGFDSGISSCLTSAENTEEFATSQNSTSDR